MSVIITEVQALGRIAVLCDEIQTAHREIRRLSDRFDIAVELQIPVDDGCGTTIDADYNNREQDWAPSDWQSSDC